MCIKEIFKRFRIYTTVFTSLLTIGLFAYGDTVLVNKNAISEIPRVPGNFDDPDSPSKNYLLNLQQITCYTTSESVPCNRVIINVYKNVRLGSGSIASWGPQQLTPGNSEPVNINNIEFKNKVVIKLTYLDNNNTEKSIGLGSINWLDGNNLHIASSDYSVNYILSYSIQATDSDSSIYNQSY